MEPVKRCVRCKQKKKGCSRGSPCERCALAGLTAEECIYLPEDATYRSPVRKRQQQQHHHQPKVTYLSTSLGKEYTATEIQRCSRCIRTARGCDRNRPCGPCAAGGLTEWECRYTSASSFKVRGPGKKQEGSPLVHALDADSFKKQVRSGSTGALPDKKSLLVPADYRTPSPPGNVSPISDTWEEAVADEESPVLSRLSVAVPIPGKPQEVVAQPRQPSSHPEYPNMMERLYSQHSNVPESSPRVLAEDYQSSPSPFNSPPFQSSPPVYGYPLDPSQYQESALVRAHRQAQQQQPYVQYGFGSGTYAGMSTSPQPNPYLYPPPRSMAGSPNTASAMTATPQANTAQRRILGSPQQRHSPQPYLVPSRRGSGVGPHQGQLGSLSGSPLGYNLQQQHVQKQAAAQQMSRSVSNSRLAETGGVPIAGQQSRTGGPVRSVYGSPSAAASSGELRSLAAQHQLQQQQQYQLLHEQARIQQQLQQQLQQQTYVQQQSRQVAAQHQTDLLQPPPLQEHDGLFGHAAYQHLSGSSESIDGEFPLFGEAEMEGEE
ncbi:hypothetical protein BCR37DRAFT_99185 [Protomyces lactucae-debilis]|uniref:Zn(2)-C6 fungal-type domain-containing protein n=1 Tax=Protomyces lactucae-debilis TaxID=2754530 RepID=A0A1Y2F501_PROLT|nr:uncharacterized protein BCR37DRAFT_99185 [Protomyces lactucae-debilis]ORY78941.1 hypothetical protein BCR37DRAFT_99185 [Protomyces lactucae-debilis]